MPRYIVSIEQESVTHRIGTLDIFEVRGREHYRFQYSEDWIGHPLRFSIDPSLPLALGVPYTSSCLWGAFQDISPDRWGRLLQRRAHGAYLSESSFMLGVSDTMRMGALRISTAEDPSNFLSPHTKIPKLVTIGELMEAIQNLENDKETPDDIKLLLQPGGSLGGARPKAIVEDEGSMWIAKFPSINDTERTALWEAMMLKLAGDLGIKTPGFKVIAITENKPVLLVKRFDRTLTGGRIPFMSAMTLLARHESSEHSGSYLEMVDTLLNVAANPVADARQLWRRMLFNVLTGNIDDHLRNHGFLHTGAGWVLAPAYDLNPTEVPFERRAHVLSFDGRTNVPNIKVCLSLAPYFRYEEKNAIEEFERIRSGVESWREVAKEVGLKAREISRMEKSFVRL